MTVLQVTLLGGPPWGLRLGNDEELRPVVSKILKNGRAASGGVRVGDVLRSVNTSPVLTCKQAHALMQKSQGQLKLGIARSSVRNPNILSGTHRCFREKNFRFDFEPSRGATKQRRRFFEEQIAKNSVTDRLLARKIQLGMLQNGAPSESTTGYDSVEADFAGGRSTTTSLRTSPSLAEADELDEITIVESPAPVNSSTIPAQQEQKAMPESDPKCETVVPDRQTVADLRRRITTCLEMKTPETASRCSSRADDARTPVPTRNSQDDFAKVHDDSGQKKPYLGRVLDGPVPPEKFYQGVLPPSYLQCHSPVSCPTPESKPPMAPVTKLQSKQHSKQNSFLNRVAKESSPAPEDPPRLVKQKESTPLASHEKSANDSQERQNFRQESRSNQNVLDQAPSSLRTAPLVEKSFDTVFHKTSMENNSSVEDELKKQLVMTSQEEKQNQRGENRMPDLLKSRSPAPFSLSITTKEHRPEKQQATTLNDDLTSSLRDALALLGKCYQAEHSNSFNVANDSGYDGSTLQNSDVTVTRDSTLSESKFDLPSGSAETFFRLAQEPSDHPETSPSGVQSTSGSDIFERKRERQDRYVGGPNGADPTPALRDGMHDRFVAESSSQYPDMSTWYRNMFKKMHKIESPAESSILRHRLRESSPAHTISRPITPLSFTAHTPTRHECELTPRRAKSVGRIVESSKFANGNSTNLFALESARTQHYHLPSYRFVHEDPRLIVTKCRNMNGFGMCGVRCLRCGLPRKDPTWSEIDATVRSICPTESRLSPEKTRQIQSRIVLRYISENLEDTARELSHFIQRLDEFWKRSNSSPQLSACGCLGEGESSSTTTAEEIAELKRISKEELMYRQKAERLAEELQDQRNRRHGYIPSSSPSLLNNKDRFGGLLDEYSRPNSTSLQSPSVVRTATALFNFDAKSPRELSLNRGDIIRIRREVDVNWLEGERNGQCGLFPRTYVQMDDEFDRSRSKAKVIYPFTSRRQTELGLKMGELVTIRREIDENWLEGTNHLGEIGIFPRSYVRFLHEPSDSYHEMLANSPDRPKTPKVFERDEHFSRSNRSSPAPAQQIPGISRNTDDVEKRLTKNAFADIRIDGHSESDAIVPSSTKTEGYFCTADKIPKGSQTYRALYKYTPRKSDEVSLEVNDIIFVVEKCDDGWYIGTVLRTGQFGTFPGNYVERH